MPVKPHGQPDPPPAPGPPPWFEAVSDIFIGNPESGVMPVRAFTAGSRVPPDLVTAHGWEALVKVPAMFAARGGPQQSAGGTPAGTE